MGNIFSLIPKKEEPRKAKFSTRFSKQGLVSQINELTTQRVSFRHKYIHGTKRRTHLRVCRTVVALRIESKQLLCQLHLQVTLH